MNLISAIVGVHVFWVREGDAFTVPGAGTTGRNAVPGAADTSWIDLGIFDNNNFEIEPKSDDKEIFAASPGKIRLYDILQSKHEIDYKFTLAQIQPLTFEHIFDTLNLILGDANQQFNPLSNSWSAKKGWLSFSFYDATDTLVLNGLQYASLKVDGAVKFGDDVVKPSMTARGLHSIYNSFNLV